MMRMTETGRRKRRIMRIKKKRRRRSTEARLEK